MSQMAEIKAAAAMTGEERAELAGARKLRDETRATWRGSDEATRTAARTAHEAALGACVETEARIQAARETRRRVVKGAWQARLDARPRAVDDAPMLLEIRVFDGR